MGILLDIIAGFLKWILTPLLASWGNISAIYRGELPSYSRLIANVLNKIEPNHVEKAIDSNK